MMDILGRRVARWQAAAASCLELSSPCRYRSLDPPIGPPLKDIHDPTERVSRQHANTESHVPFQMPDEWHVACFPS